MKNRFKMIGTFIIAIFYMATLTFIWDSFYWVLTGKSIFKWLNKTMTKLEEGAV